MPPMKLITNNIKKTSPRSRIYLVRKQNYQVENVLLLSMKCLLFIWSRRYCTSELTMSDINLSESMHTFASRCIQLVPERQSCNLHGGHYLMVKVILTSPWKGLVHLCVFISWRAGTDESPGGKQDCAGEGTGSSAWGAETCVEEGLLSLKRLKDHFLNSASSFSLWICRRMLNTYIYKSMWIWIFFSSGWKF